MLLAAYAPPGDHWILGARLDDEPRQPGRGLAGLTKRPGRARDTNGDPWGQSLLPHARRGHGGKGSWKASRRIMLCVVISKQGSTAQALVHIFHSTEPNKVIYTVVYSNRHTSY